MNFSQDKPARRVNPAAIAIFVALAVIAGCVSFLIHTAYDPPDFHQITGVKRVASSNGRIFTIEYRLGSNGFSDLEFEAIIRAVEDGGDVSRVAAIPIDELYEGPGAPDPEPRFREIYVSDDAECYMFFDKTAIYRHDGEYDAANLFHYDNDISPPLPANMLPIAKILASSRRTPDGIQHLCRRFLDWQSESADIGADEDWAKLRMKPTKDTGGREVEIPDGADARKWATAGGGRRIAGSPGAVEYGTDGAMFDENGRYWVAVGPAVMNPGRDPSAKISREEMRYGTEMDIVVRDGEGNAYYVYATVGGAKDHTYPNGVYGTNVSFSDPAVGAEETPSGSVVEFMGASSVRDLRGYEIVKLIVYD